MANYQDVIELLYNALLDKEFANDKELYQVCLDAKADLDKNESENFIFSKLGQSLSWYLMAHKYDAPKMITDLANTSQKILQKYRGTIATTQILCGLFGGQP